MSRSVAPLLLIILGPTASAANGLVVLELTSEHPAGNCLHPNLGHCAASIEDRGTPESGDDVIHIEPILRKVQVTSPLGPPGGVPSSIGYDRGRFGAPLTLRHDVLDAVQWVDDMALDDRIDHEEQGPWALFFYVRVPGYENEEHNDTLVVPLLLPVIEPDGVWVRAQLSTLGVEEGLTLAAELTQSCWFSYALPDAADPLLCFDVDITPVTHPAAATLPDVQVGYRVDAVEVRLRAQEARAGTAASSPPGAGAPLGQPPERPSSPAQDAHAVATAEPWHPPSPSRPHAAIAEAAPHAATSIPPQASNPIASPWWPALLLAALIWPLLRLYRRITPRAALEHELRADILRRVRRNPGIQPGLLARDLGCAFKTVAHHVRVLHEFGLLDVETRARTIHLFERGTHPAVAKQLHVANRGNRAAVLRHVAANPGTTGAALARALDLARSSAHAHLAALHAQGLIQRQGKGWEISPTTLPHWGSLVPTPQAAQEPVANPAAPQGM